MNNKQLDWWLDGFSTECGDGPFTKAQRAALDARTNDLRAWTYRQIVAKVGGPDCTGTREPFTPNNPDGTYSPPSPAALLRELGRRDARDATYALKEEQPCLTT